MFLLSRLVAVLVFGFGITEKHIYFLFTLFCIFQGLCYQPPIC